MPMWDRWERIIGHSRKLGWLRYWNIFDILKNAPDITFRQERILKICSHSPQSALCKEVRFIQVTSWNVSVEAGQSGFGGLTSLCRKTLLSLLSERSARLFVFVFLPVAFSCSLLLCCAFYRCICNLCWLSLFFIHSLISVSYSLSVTLFAYYFTLCPPVVQRLQTWFGSIDLNVSTSVLDSTLTPVHIVLLFVFFALDIELPCRQATKKKTVLRVKMSFSSLHV